MSSVPSPAASRPWVVAVILCLFLSLAIYYNISTPVYESPDELQHAAFVVWLANEHSLPIVNPEEPGPWKQEGTQPPLYYLIAAALVGGLPHDGADGLATLNPYANIGDPQRPDNKNRVLHDMEQERWPYETGVLFVHLARAVSTLMAVGTLAAVHRLGRIVFPQRAGIALGMVALVAFTPQFLFLSASINNDNLAILIASWVLVLLASWLRAPGLPGWLSLAGLGVLLGMGALAKFSGVLLWPLALGTLLWLARRERDHFDGRWGLVRWLILAGLLVFGLALALSGWWFVRNQQLYGDLSGLGPHLEIMGTRRRFPSWESALREFRGFRFSFWALFGWFNILAPEPFYWVMDGLTVLGVLGLGIFLFRFWRRLRGQAQLSWEARQLLVLLGAWLVLVLVGVVRWTMLTPASQGRLLYPALAAIALFLVVGWAELVPRHLGRALGAVASIGWVVWAALCPFLFIMPAYALPERLHDLDELSVTLSDLYVRYGDCCELVGYALPDQAVHPGDRVPLTLVWRALEETDQAYSLFVHATTADGQIVGQMDSYHGGGMYPTSQWRLGEIIVDTVYVPLSSRAEGPALIRFNVGLHKMSEAERLPALAPDGQEMDVVFAGEAALLPAEWPRTRPDLQTEALFGTQIRLVGTEFSQTAARPGEVVTVTLQWEALARITEDYVGFVHLVDPASGNVTQDDHLPMNGRYPTRLWFPGAIISDPYRLELPYDLSAGTYELWAGLYQSQSGQRLQAMSQKTGNRWKDDLVPLGSLVVISDG
jgi:4-amino-4-deoxy-L-arabinose transferase-like glycosyltransferase